MMEFDRIIGYCGEKAELERIADILKNKEHYNKLGVRSPRGLLLYGAPGLGKSLMAKCLINASGRPCFECRKDQPNGEFVKTIKRVFQEAKEKAPSIVFLDDLDKFANADRHHRDAEEYVTVQSCIDEVQDKDVFVLATVNDMGRLPESLCRAGRFDLEMLIEVPKTEEAEAIIRHYLSGKRCAETLDPKLVTKMLRGRSCAELEAVVNAAGRLAGFDRSESINMDHFTRACFQMISGSPAYYLEDRQEIDMSDPFSQAGEAVYHEAGHAVLAELLIPQSVVIVALYRREMYQGFVHIFHSEPLHSVAGREKDAMIDLAGMAAVELLTGRKSSGCSGDLKKAYGTVRDLLCDDCNSGFFFKEPDYIDHSDYLGQIQENATSLVLEHLYQQVKGILARNRDFLDRLALELAEKRILNELDVQRVKGSCAVTAITI